MFPLLKNCMNLIKFSVFANSPSLATSRFLTPVCPQITSSCGYKVFGKVHRRCKDCFLVVRDRRSFVECKTHGRHKQMSLVKKPKNTWILTHATQGPVRPW